MRIRTSLRRKLRLVGFALFVLPTASLLAATPTSVASREISIPFDPPLAKELRYRVTTTKPRGKEIVTASLEQTLRFSKSATGYVMDVTPVRIFKPGGPSLDIRTNLNALPPGLRPLLRPYSYDLDEDGSVVRIRDWEAIKADLTASEESMATMIEPDPAKRVDARHIAHAVIAMYTGLTAEQAPTQLLKTWTPLLGHGGTVLDEGAVRTVEIEIEAPLLPAPVSAQATVELKRGDKPGTLRLVQQTELDSKGVNAAIEHLFERLAKEPLSDPKGRKNLEQASEKIRGMSLTHSIEILFDGDTGLPLRATLKRKAQMPNGDKADQIDVIEQLD